MLIKVIVFQRVNANAEFLYFCSIAFSTMELDVFAVYR